jgi:hypothetical protein
MSRVRLRVEVHQPAQGDAVSELRGHLLAQEAEKKSAPVRGAVSTQHQ